MSSQDLVGRTLGQYELRELLGVGGMGAVYKGYQASLERDVAVKVMIPSLEHRHDYEARFIREARTAAALEHVHIVPVHDYGVQDGISYVAMRLLTGGDLAERIEHSQRTDQPLPSLHEVARITSEMASALQYAHDQGVIHRDIKARNVMFDNRGNVFLVDFGIAKLAGATSGLTRTGAAVGTPWYMSPEQWQGRDITSAVDQYALAIVVYIMLTGKMPFEADTPWELMNKHVHEAPIPISTWRQDLPAEIMPVLARALEKAPEKRHASVMAFSEAFDDALRDSPVAQPSGFFEVPIPRPSLSTVITTTEPRPRQPPPSRRRLIGIGSVAVVIVAVAVAAVLLLNPGPPPTEIPSQTNTLIALTSVPTSSSGEVSDIEPSITNTPPAVATATTNPTTLPTVTPGRSPTSAITATPARTRAVVILSDTPFIIPEAVTPEETESVLPLSDAPTVTDTPSPTPTFSPVLPTNTRVPSDTPTAMPSPTDIPTKTLTPSPIPPTNTRTPTYTPTLTTTPTATLTKTVTSSPIPPTSTRLPTRTPTLTPTETLTSTSTPQQISALSPCMLADLDRSGEVDIFDIRLLTRAYGSHTGDVLFLARYDFDESGEIDILDLRRLATQYGQICTGDQ